MNRVAKTVILSIAALATVASSVEFASAGDRYWRRHHVVKPWKSRVVIGGVAAGIVAGAVIASRPRVIYREDPVIVDQGPVYDRETVYDDDTVYADPDDNYRADVYRDDAPDSEDYATRTYDDSDERVYDEDRIVGTENNYFPDRPEALAKDKPKVKVPKKVLRQEADASAANLKPWTKEWRDWCSGRYSSFNPQNGTYLGYDKKRYFCKAS